MQFLRAVSHCIMQSQTLRIPDNSDDKSDTAADAETRNATTSTALSDMSDRCEVGLL